MNDISKQITIRPRNAHFEIDESDRMYWHGGDPARTIVYNALSTLFPEGERLFMDSVRAHRDQIKDPVLKEQVKAFLRQEAMHSREHVDYNLALDAQGFSASHLHELAGKRLGIVRGLGWRRMLACTCALEHFTATFADELLSDPSYLEEADDKFKELWTWHCIEEIEHKGVAFDVYREIYTGFGDYIVRARVMFLAMVVFSSMVIAHAGHLLRDQGMSRSPKAWFGVLNYLFGRPGLFRRMTPSLLWYMVPRYHPWNKDNRELITSSEQRLEALRARSVSSDTVSTFGSQQGDKHRELAAPAKNETVSGSGVAA